MLYSASPPVVFGDLHVHIYLGSMSSNFCGLFPLGLRSGHASIENYEKIREKKLKLKKMPPLRKNWQFIPGGIPRPPPTFTEEHSAGAGLSRFAKKHTSLRNRGQIANRNLRFATAS